MSGGVDSSLAAALVVQSGAEAIGVTMKLSASGSRCCSLEDADDARRVAERLGIRFYVANYADAFGREVIEGFADAYLAGRTPIPCIACNQRFKFDHLLERATVFGAARVATGHYARVEHEPETGRARLFRARHREKDQTYFLFSLRQEQLRRALFPVGEMSKDAVREMARQLGLATADKPESQEICFVPDGDYAKVVEQIRPEATALRGEIVDEGGRVLGHHRGIHRFTVGQRHGLGIASDRRLYVLRLEPERQRVVVGDAGALDCGGARVERVHWIAGGAPSGAIRARVQVRHRHVAVPATVRAVEGDCAEIEFDEAVRAVAPGQAAVFYDEANDDEVIGGGFLVGGLR
ncbi:MAG: tRNA 2-thiouridine(34) synthase MnmA [Deltaproteobacteria bacterium]|nr:tRNA 2-thiouridine(34) synthase MnmA [Deltaproteobacteria bacterium]